MTDVTITIDRLIEARFRGALLARFVGLASGLAMARQGRIPLAVDELDLDAQRQIDGGRQMLRESDALLAQVGYASTAKPLEVTASGGLIVQVAYGALDGLRAQERVRPLDSQQQQEREAIAALIEKVGGSPSPW